MIKWIIILVLVALVAGALGFTGVARAAGTGAKVLLGILVAGLLLLALILYFAAGSVV